MGNEDLMEQTIKFVRSIRRKAKAKEVEWEYVPNAETRAAIEECESGTELDSAEKWTFTKEDATQAFEDFVSSR